MHCDARVHGIVILYTPFVRRNQKVIADRLQKLYGGRPTPMQKIKYIIIEPNNYYYNMGTRVIGDASKSRYII